MNQFYSRAEDRSLAVVWRGTGFQRGEISAVRLDENPEMNVTEDDIWMISRAIVQPESMRSRGIGSEMMRRLKEELRKVRCKKCYVAPGGYSERQEDQFRFYEKNGFERINPQGLFVLKF